MGEVNVEAFDQLRAAIVDAIIAAQREGDGWTRSQESCDKRLVESGKAQVAMWTEYYRLREQVTGVPYYRVAS